MILYSSAIHIESFIFFSKCPVEILFFWCEPRSLNILGKCLITEVHLHPPLGALTIHSGSVLGWNNSAGL